MRVTDKRRKPNAIVFKDLKYGDVFQDEAEDICMKIDNNCSLANAIVLSSGFAFKCDLDMPVLLLNAEVIIISDR